jgi:hypothetical protein
MTTSAKTLSNSWWNRLRPARRQAWLEAASSDRRERTPEAAYGLKISVQAGTSIIRTYTTSTAELVGQVIRIPLLHAEFLIDLANEIYDEDYEQERTSRCR